MNDNKITKLVPARIETRGGSVWFKFDARVFYRRSDRCFKLEIDGDPRLPGNGTFRMGDDEQKIMEALVMLLTRLQSGQLAPLAEPGSA